MQKALKPARTVAMKVQDNIFRVLGPINRQGKGYIVDLVIKPLLVLTSWDQ